MTTARRSPRCAGCCLALDHTYPITSKLERLCLQEDLDAEMDAYFLKDSKTAAQRLDTDLDAYFKEKPAEAAAQPAAVAEGEGAKQ